jgi:hypothetical protein
MTSKIIFTVPFYHACRAQPLLPPRLLHRGAIKLVVPPAQPTSSHTISHHLLTSFPMAEKKEENRETNLKK